MGGGICFRVGLYTLALAVGHAVTLHPRMVGALTFLLNSVSCAHSAAVAKEVSMIEDTICIIDDNITS